MTQTDTPAPATVDHGRGVHSIAVPIPDNPLGSTLVYVLESDAGPVLVDTGWDDPVSYEALGRGLEILGTSITDVHGMLITHAHPDHHGLSAQVQDACGGWIAMHPADADHIRQMTSAPRGAWQDYHLKAMQAAGAPEEALTELRGLRELKLSSQPRGPRFAIPDRELNDGVRAPVPGRRITSVWTPGHTPGHVCLYLEDDQRLLSGDHLLPSITPHIGLYDESPEADPLGDFLGSLAAVAAMPVSGVLPAHQYPFTDHAGRVAEITAVHEARLTALHVRMSATPLTLWEIAVGMDWNRPWERLNVQNRLIALSEAAAHLRHMVRRGQAGQAPGGKDPVRYEAR